MNAFEVMGFDPAFRIDAEELERRYRELLKVHHPDRHVGKSASERRMHVDRAVLVNQAFRTLSDDVSRAEELFAVMGGKLPAEDATSGDGEFLFEMMTLQERVAEARGTGEQTELSEIKREIEDQKSRIFSEFSGVRDLSRAQQLLVRLKYLARISETL